MLLPSVIPIKVRAIFRAVAMAYSGFLLTGQGLRTLNSLTVIEGLLGALEGVLLISRFPPDLFQALLETYLPSPVIPCPGNEVQPCALAFERSSLRF